MSVKKLEMATGISLWGFVVSQCDSGNLTPDWFKQTPQVSLVDKHGQHDLNF